jgi:hypothetical protein
LFFKKITCIPECIPSPENTFEHWVFLIYEQKALLFRGKGDLKYVYKDNFKAAFLDKQKAIVINADYNLQV